MLLICTETYHRRFKGREEPGRGKGAQWEGAVITQELYDKAAYNTKFIPVIFSSGDERHIPTIVRGVSRYCLPDGYEQLYRHLTGQPLVDEAPLGQVRRLPPTPHPQPPHSKDLVRFLAPSFEQIRFNWDDLKDVIVAFHEVITLPNPSSESMYDFSDVDLERKNELNRLGKDYFRMMLDHHEPHFGAISGFLKNPINSEIQEKYFEVVDELRAKLAAMRSQGDRFEVLLLHYVDQAALQGASTLKIKRSVLNVLVSFMYVNCDIGQKE